LASLAKQPEYIYKTFCFLFFSFSSTELVGVAQMLLPHIWEVLISIGWDTICPDWDSTTVRLQLHHSKSFPICHSLLSYHLIVYNLAVDIVVKQPSPKEKTYE
jgi:hypothetical protein